MSESVSEPRPEAEIPAYRNWKFWAGSLATLLVVGALGYWAWNIFNASPYGPSAPVLQPTMETPGNAIDPDTSLPVVSASVFSAEIMRTVEPHTDIPDRGSAWVSEYVVQRGDSLSSIAALFDLTWQSILWANTDTLKDDPNFLIPGKTLYILPVNGAFYQWQEKDTLESVAASFSLGDEEQVPAIMDAILNWPGNDLNPLDPVIPVGTWVIIPGGKRPFIWEAPMVITGTTRTWALGPGVCPGKYNGVPGTGAWVWPTTTHYLSGYDFGATHNGIDIFIYMGQPIFAADAGVVVFAGWSDRGYGNLVIIDHLNGWNTFYAHLSQWNVNCGQQVYAGSIIGLGGSTGNSTGPHLHFETRWLGAATSPWAVLPPP
jgi:murein DD-endopeptidase MepM/ murein hydrolase activator NlpD